MKDGFCSFDGKVALVTGAAGGIGTATALQLARRGALIAAVDRAGVAMDQLKTEVPSDKLLPLEADVRNEADVAGYVAATVKRFGRIDVFFNNAGIVGRVSPITACDADHFREVMETNVVGVLLGLKHVLPVMVAQGSGAVVNSCSVAGLRGGSGLPAYVASKHAVLGLTRSAANEVAGKGVRVVCIAPGAIQGAMLQGHMSQLGSDVAAIQHQLDASVPMGRSGTNEEVARLVTFLASEEASYCTGSAYVIDGGLMA